MRPTCIEAECDAPPVARLAVTAHPSDQRPLLAAIRPWHSAPAIGAPVCADHLHGVIDELLMTAMPPPTPPATETTP